MPASVFAACRAPLQAQSAIQFWLDRESCPSWHWISWRLLPKGQLAGGRAYCGGLPRSLFSMCGEVTARKRNSTKVSLCRRVFLKLNRHILHWTQCTVNWSVTCFWYCRTAEDTLQRLRFWLLLTYLLSVVISRTTITYKNVKIKRKCHQNYN